jgi:hypothetical protein
VEIGSLIKAFNYCLLHQLLEVKSFSSGIGHLELRLALPVTAEIIRVLDARGDTPQATFQPALQNVEIGSLIKAFNYSLSSTACCTSCWKLSPSVRVSVIWSCAWPCQ